MDELEEICKYFEYQLIKALNNLIEIKKEDQFISIVAYYNNMEEINFKSFTYNEKAEFKTKNLEEDLMMRLKKYYFKNANNFKVNTRKNVI